MTFEGPLEDRVGIRELYDAYSDAVCRADTDAYLACWTEHPVRTGVGGEFADGPGLRAHWEGIWGAIERMAFFTQIAAIDVDVDVGSDEASARAYCLEMITMKGGETLRLVGEYDDRLERVGGRWLYAARDYRIFMGG